MASPDSTSSVATHRDGVHIDRNAVARDCTWHVRKYLPHDVHTGRNACRLVTHLEMPVIEREVLNIHYVEPITIARLRKVLDGHRDNTR